MSQRAIEYLESLQKHAISRYGEGDFSDPRTREAARAAMDRSLRERGAAGLLTPEEVEAVRIMKARLDEPMPTPYEDPNWYLTLSKLAADLSAAAERLHGKGESLPLFGTLPTGRLNAMAILVPGSDEQIVVFDTGVFMFALLMAKVLAMALPTKEDPERGAGYLLDPAGIEAHLEQNPEVVRRFLEVLVAYAESGRPANAPSYFIDNARRPFSDFLLTGIERFVLGHELGHVRAGHLLERVQTTQVLDFTVEEVQRNWVQEFEADVVGFELLIDSMQASGFDLSLSVLPAVFTFECFEATSRATSLLALGRENENFGTPTHPPPTMRKESLLQTLSNAIDEERYESVVSLCEGAGTAMKIVWERARPYLVALHERGPGVQQRWAAVNASEAPPPPDAGTPPQPLELRIAPHH